MEQDVSLRKTVFSELISEKQVIICHVHKNQEIMQAGIKIIILYSMYSDIRTRSWYETC